MEDENIYRLELDNPIHLITPVRLINPQSGREVLTDAYWDTGAAVSVIGRLTAEYLKLPVLTDRCTTEGLGGKTEGRTLLTVALPGDTKRGIIVEAFEAERLPRDHEFIVGMDIISRGDFTLKREGKHVVLEFRFADDFFHII